MKKVLALGAVLTSMCSFADDSCEVNYDNAFDGLSLFAGINYSSDKNESVVDFESGNAAVLTQKVVYRKTWTDNIKNQLPAAIDSVDTTKGAAQKTAYEIIAYGLVEGDSNHALGLPNLAAFDENGKALDSVLVSSEVSDSKPLLGYTFNKTISAKGSKNARNIGGLLGVAYRFAPASTPGWLFGINFDLVVRGKGKKTQMFGAAETNKKLSGSEAVDFGSCADKNTYDKFLDDVASNDLSKITSNFNPDSSINPTQGSTGDQITDNSIFVVNYTYPKDLASQFGLAESDFNVTKDAITGQDVTGYNDITNAHYIVDHKGRTNLKREIQHSCIIPSLDLTVGHKFANGKFLAEGFAGLTFVNAKAKIYNALSGALVKEHKVNKVAPSIGLNFAYAINESTSAGIKGRYIFNAKKDGLKVSSNYNISAYVAWHPKALLAD